MADTLLVSFYLKKEFSVLYHLRFIFLIFLPLGQLELNSQTEGKNETPEDVEDNDDEQGENMDKANEDVECPLALKLKIHSSITMKILPQLHKCLTKKVRILLMFLVLLFMLLLLLFTYCCCL